MRRILAIFCKLRNDERGSVFLEYILLLTIVGLGAVIGIAVARTALIEELSRLAQGISQLILP